MIGMDSGFNSNFSLKIDSGRVLSIITNDYKAIKTSKVSLSKNLFNGYDSPIS